MIHCICAINPHCQSPVAIYDVDLSDDHESNKNYSVSCIVAGSMTGCYPLDSLLLSSLECFYSHSKCFPILMKYIKDTYMWNVEYPSWIVISPLIYNQTSNHYPPNSSISMITKNIMIEQWNESYSFDHFYKLCRPTHCYYDEITRNKTFLDILLTLSSILGSLISALRFIIPRLIKFIRYLLSRNSNRQQQQQQGNFLNKHL